MVVFQRDARIHGALVEMVQLLQPVENVIFDGFGQGHVVRRKNQFHVSKMQPTREKIQFFLGFERPSEIRANFLVSGRNRIYIRPCRWSQGLQLSQRLTQSLVLAPQLQQSLALLQAPTLELKALVEQELEQNPVLEEIAEPETELRGQAGAGG